MQAEEKREDFKCALCFIQMPLSHSKAQVTQGFTSHQKTNTRTLFFCTHTHPHSLSLFLLQSLGLMETLSHHGLALQNRFRCLHFCYKSQFMFKLKLSSLTEHLQKISVLLYKRRRRRSRKNASGNFKELLIITLFNIELLNIASYKNFTTLIIKILTMDYKGSCTRASSKIQLFHSWLLMLRLCRCVKQFFRW